MAKKRARGAKNEVVTDSRRMGLLILDRELPGAELALTKWCIARGFSFACPVSRVEQGFRFVLVGRMGRRPAVTYGSRDLDALVRNAWPSLRGRSLDAAGDFEAILANSDRSQLAEWIAQAAPPSSTRPVVSACRQGFVSVFASAEAPRIQESSLPGLMLRVADALLVASGLDAPNRAGISGPLPGLAGVTHREMAGEAIVEHGAAAVFGEGGDGCGTIILSGDYVLPVDGAVCSMHVAAALVVHRGLRTKEPGEFSVRSLMFGWMGLAHQAAEARVNAVLDSLKAQSFVADWFPPASVSTPAGVPEVVHAMSRQSMLRRDAELEAARAETRRAERRARDREANLLLERDAARAALDRERERAKQERRASLPACQSVEAVSVNASVESDRRVDELESRCAELQAVADDRAEEVDALRQVLHAVEAERDAAASAIAEMGVSPAVSARMPMATTLSELGGWSHRALDGKVVVVPRALRSARKSNFGDPALVYRVLEALRDDYWAMKFDPSGDAKTRWQQFLRRERLTCGPTGNGPESRLAETYHATWDGQRVPLDMHLQGHSGRDEVRQFRLYFHNDEAARRIVIGHLPSHLPSRDT